MFKYLFWNKLCRMYSILYWRLMHHLGHLLSSSANDLHYYFIFKCCSTIQTCNGQYFNIPRKSNSLIKNFKERKRKLYIYILFLIFMIFLLSGTFQWVGIYFERAKQWSTSDRTLRNLQSLRRISREKIPHHSSKQKSVFGNYFCPIH